ncbi:MAG: phosphatase PAP2 family protein [Lachnospiraceae bacterium]|nr:phosphatase PAP2 family protein [Lachnospiraceae bacterium]
MNKNKFKAILHKYKHASLLLYVFIYFPWFFLLENLVTHYTPIHIRLDDFIPFCEYFIVPYLLWFLYITVPVVYFLFTDKKSYYYLCAHLFIGMTIFLIICTVWPNGQDLRPIYFERDNIFTDMVRTLYSGDTHTNVFPSLHVYNSVVTHIAIAKSEKLRKYKWLRISSFVLMVSICLATVFLKQHSCLDLFGGLVLCFLVYKPVYCMDHSYLISLFSEEDSYS